MTHGTVLVLGNKSREIELLIARLEKEQYSVYHYPANNQAYRGIKHNNPQSVLINATCSPAFIQRVVRTLLGHKRLRYVPVLLVTDLEVPARLHQIRGVGETFKLHTIPLALAMRRLHRAVALSQLHRTLVRI